MKPSLLIQLARLLPPINRHQFMKFPNYGREWERYANSRIENSLPDDMLACYYAHYFNQVSIGIALRPSYQGGDWKWYPFTIRHGKMVRDGGTKGYSKQSWARCQRIATKALQQFDINDLDQWADMIPPHEEE